MKDFTEFPEFIDKEMTYQELNLMSVNFLLHLIEVITRD